MEDGQGTAPTTLDELCGRLSLAFDRDSGGAGVAGLLGAYAGGAADWSSLLWFDREQYTRNLLHRTGDYELLLLCWDRGQASPIHDHAGQSCWMAVLDGLVEEVHYRPCAPGGAGPLTPGRSRRYETGQVAFIDDDIALHLIRPARDRGVTLHLYSRPIDSCRIYDPRAGASRRVDLGYHSVRGKPCSADPVQVRRAYTF